MAQKKQIRKLVKEEKVQMVHFDGAEPNQFVTNLADGMKIYQSNQCDAVAADKNIKVVLL